MNGPLASSATDQNQAAANRKRSTLVDQMPASKKLKLESTDDNREEEEDDDRPEEDIKLEVRLTTILSNEEGFKQFLVTLSRELTLNFETTQSRFPYRTAC